MNQADFKQKALLAIETLRARVRDLERTRQEDIAIIGLAARFPGAPDADAFWSLLQSGTDAVTTVPPDRWDVDAFYDSNPDAPGKMFTRRAGFIDEVTSFDAQFFGISPREAMYMDPQHRLMLETAWHALEHAGIAPASLSGTRAGVFMGLSTHEFLGILIKSLNYAGIDVYSGTGTSPAAAVGRISYRLGLEGPAVAIDTACSSSLVAVHQACQALRGGECDLALAGGVNAILSPAPMINLSRARMVAPDGRCKTFDAAADGYARGEGCGVIVLKRLGDARRDGDRVRAVVRGSAVNQDGASGGLTVPNGRAQQRVIADALRQAGLDPSAVDYLEAHGTGTPLGDPIEVRAAAAALRPDPAASHPLWIGSVKTNIGHLEAAAGIAGVIKVVLALEHEELPRHLHFSTPSPHIPWNELPVEVVQETRRWHTNGTPRAAGISSFGFSGTNAHVIIAEAPPRADAASAEIPAVPSHLLLPLSARAPAALNTLVRKYAEWFSTHGDAVLADVCSSAAVGRSHLEHRAALVVDSTERARRMLRAVAEERAVPGAFTGICSNPPKTAWLFTGQGSPYAGMGRELYHTYPVVRETLDACQAVLDTTLDVPLLSIFEDDVRLRNTHYAQPALFALEMALARLWQSWGLQPDVLLGHSVGQYAAACVAGVFTLEEGLRLIAARGALFGALPSGGRMAAVFADATSVERALEERPDVSVAADNGAHIVISGLETSIDEVIAAFERQGVRCDRLDTSHAFHSALLDPALEAFEARARQISCATPQRTLICNLSGKVLTTSIDAGYWRRHAREPVRFGQSVQTLSQLGCELLLEVGPQPVLAAMALRAWPEHRQPPRTVASLRRETPSTRQIMEALGHLYVAGCRPDFRAVYGSSPRQRVDLPAYPFQRRPFWFRSSTTTATSEMESAPAAPIGDVVPTIDGGELIDLPSTHLRASRSGGQGEHQIPEVQSEAVAAAGAWLAAIEPGERERQVVEFLRVELGRALGVDPASIDPEAPFATLGIDSLMATELRSRVQTTLGASIPASVFVFTYPTIASLAQGLLERWTEVQRDPTKRENTIPAVARGGALAPSYAQEQLWFLQQLAPSSSAYNIAVRIRIRGAFDHQLLVAAFDALVGRHEALRTTFRNEGGIPQAVIAAPFHVDVPVHDAANESDVGRWERQDAGTAFDLTAGPLFRVRLLRLDSADHVLLVTMHHIITDGWSFKVFSRDLAAIYAGLQDGRQPALPPLAIQYPDYAAWQRERLQGNALDELLAFWKRNLEGAPVLELTTDRPRPPRPTFQGARLRFALGRGRAQALRALCVEENLTLFVPLLSTFAALLQRYSGQDDFVVGTITANRERPEVENLIGFFANALPLRLHLDGDPSVGELLIRIRDCARDALAHQEAPFDLIVNAVERQRDVSRNPLFQVQFVLQAAVAAVLDGVDVELAEIDTHTAKRDLTLTIFDDATMTGHVEYATDLFDAVRIEQLIRHFETLCDALTAVDRRRTLSSLSLLSDAERALRAKRHGARSIQEMFEDAVDLAPDRVAVAAADRTLTYRDLDAAANRVAHWLRGRGVGPNTPVALRMGRTVDLPIAMLGILKAGGTYVPLDPAYPSERIDFMRHDAGAGVVIDSLDDTAIVRESAQRPAVPAGADDIAYIIYTSGSTGTPKGVRIAHESVIEYADTLARTLGIGPADVYLHTASISFSSSIRQFLVPLTAGASVVVASRDECRDPLALLRRIRDSKVTVVDLVPTVVRHIVDAARSLAPGERDELLDQRLRLLLTASEPLRYGLVHDWRAIFGSRARWINMYGQTETTGIVSLHEVGEARADDQRIVPLGRPRDNVSMWVLDKQRRPLPAGMAGDLYIGGVALARSYTGDPAITDERFIADALGGERLYAAGDVVRLGWDGAIEFLGRADQQIKVRGLRIEPAEIERAILAHPGVHEAVVAVADGPDGPRLLAYFTTKAPGVSASAIRAHARERLPEHMVPSAIIPIDQVPLTANGKIDRSALPQPETVRAAAQEFVDPRPGTEQALADIWRQVLRAERIGAGDNFFELGGHSLLAAQVRSRIKKAFAVELPLTAIFEDQTLTALAQRIENSASTSRAGALPELAAAVRSTALPATHAQALAWQRELTDPGSPGHWIDVGLRVLGRLDVDRLVDSVHTAVARHELLRTVYDASNGSLTQRILGSYRPDVHVLDPHTPEPLREDRIDLSAQPPFIAEVMSASPDDHTLNVRVHRIMNDGLGTRLLLSDIGAIYMNMTSGTDHFPLLDTSLQYADFAGWERSWLTVEAVTAHVECFRRAFRGVDAAFVLPTDHPRPAVRRCRGARITLELPRTLCAAAAAAATREQASLYTILLAAFASALGRCTGRQEVVIGSAVSRRTHPRTEQMLGQFMNIVPLRIGSVQDTEPGRLVRHVRGVLLDVLAHQDAPFQHVAAALAADHGPAAARFDQVVFVMGDAAPREMTANDLRLSRVEPGEPVSRRDLTVSALAAGGDISVTLTYDADLFHASTIQRLADDFAASLETMVPGSAAPRPIAHSAG